MGDSIIYGECAGTATAPPIVLASLTGKTVSNMGIGGNRADQCASRWIAEGPYSGASTLVWSCAVNSLLNLSTGAQTWADAKVAIDAAKAAGKRVIVTRVTPWKAFPSWTVGKGAAGDAYNTLAAAEPGITYLDTYATMGGQGGDPAALLDAYNCLAYNDHLHVSVAGQSALAGVVNAADP